MLIYVPTRRRIIEPRRQLPAGRWHRPHWLDPRRVPLLGMAYTAGQVELDTSGNVGLTTDGKVVVDKACAACTQCPDTTMPGSWSFTTSGVTACACGVFQITSGFNTTATLLPTDDCTYKATIPFHVSDSCGGGSCFDGDLDGTATLAFSFSSPTRFILFKMELGAQTPTGCSSPFGGELFYHFGSFTGDCTQTFTKSQSIATASGSCFFAGGEAGVRAYGGSVTLTPA